MKMNAELFINVLKDYLEAKDLEIVKNLYKGDNYVRLKWKYAKDIFSGQQITGLDFPDGKIGLTSKHSTADEIENMLKLNGLYYKSFKGYDYHFTVDRGKLKIDFLSLYKNDSDKFMNYFRLLNKEEKKEVLKEALDCEYTNEKVTEWLSEHETDLLREISFNN
jgi:hypothetical protein